MFRRIAIKFATVLKRGPFQSILRKNYFVLLRIRRLVVWLLVRFRRVRKCHDRGCLGGEDFPVPVRGGAQTCDSRSAGASSSSGRCARGGHSGLPAWPFAPGFFLAPISRCWTSHRGAAAAAWAAQSTKSPQPHRSEQFLPQSPCLLPLASGDARCRWPSRRAMWVGVGDLLVRWGGRVIPVGIAAMCLGFVLKSAGTQAGPADTALPGPSISVFGTIHPDIFRLRTPLGSGHRSERVRVASLEPQIRFDAPADAMP